VIGVGEEKTPESLRKVCNRFIFIENIVASAEAVRPADSPEHRPEPARADQPKTPTPIPVSVNPGLPNPTAPKQPAAKLPPSKAVPKILAAMKKIGIEEDVYSLSQLGSVLTQLFPDFDSRSYGSAKLSDLLKRTGRFEVQKSDGTHLQVRDKA
jgi:hypothetical protein